MSPSQESTPAANSRPLAVLVVDDQHAVREGVAQLIAGAPLTLRHIDTAATLEEARRIASLRRPDLVVLDADLAGQDGLALIGQLGPVARVLVLSSHGDAKTRARARRLGAVAFIEKQQPATDLIRAIVELAALPVEGEKAPGQEGTSSRGGSVVTSGAPPPVRA